MPDTPQNDPGHKWALEYERQFREASEHDKGEALNALFQEIAGQSPPTKLPRVELTLAEWYGSTVQGDESATARAIIAQRVERMGVVGEPTSAPSTITNDLQPCIRPNSRGPRPEKRQKTAESMSADYDGRLDQLSREKEETLSARYGVSRDTVRRARNEVLKFRQFPTIDK
jgi:hypothetical protein